MEKDNQSILKEKDQSQLQYEMIVKLEEKSRLKREINQKKSRIEELEKEIQLIEKTLSPKSKIQVGKSYLVELDPGYIFTIETILDMDEREISTREYTLACGLCGEASFTCFDELGISFDDSEDMFDDAVEISDNEKNILLKYGLECKYDDAIEYVKQLKAKK